MRITFDVGLSALGLIFTGWVFTVLMSGYGQ